MSVIIIVVVVVVVTLVLYHERRHDGGHLMPNAHRRRRCDATKQFRLVGVGGVYWAKSAESHTPNCKKSYLFMQVLYDKCLNVLFFKFLREIMRSETRRP